MFNKVFSKKNSKSLRFLNSQLLKNYLYSFENFSFFIGYL